MSTVMKIAVFGLGKLGSVISSLHASAGHQVTGVDLSRDIVDAINSGTAPFSETGLQELLEETKSNFEATTIAEAAVSASDASIVIVPTPSGPDGTFSNKYILEALLKIGTVVRNSDKRHTVIIASTVMPGSCSGEIRQALELASGKRVGEGIGLVYNPQFIALGSIVLNMRKPDLILIGESDSESGQIALDLALAIAENEPAVSRIGLTSAEVAKLAINTFVTTKISFANMLGEFCDALGDANVDHVTSAVGSDSRIGVKYLQGALGYGGPCFPRDNIALAASAAELGVDASIAIATDRVNDRQVLRIRTIVAKVTARGGSIALMGLAYKPYTPVCDQSQAIEIANSLIEEGYTVRAYDENVSADDLSSLSPGVRVHAEPAEEMYSSDVVIFTHPVGSFKKLDLSRFRDSIVLDIWGSSNEIDFPANVTILRPGRLGNVGLVST